MCYYFFFLFSFICTSISVQNMVNVLKRLYRMIYIPPTHPHNQSAHRFLSLSVMRYLRLSIRFYAEVLLRIRPPLIRPGGAYLRLLAL